MNYQGGFDSFQKETVEKVLDVRLAEIAETINDRANNLLDELEKGRIKGQTEILAKIGEVTKAIANIAKNR